MKIIIWTVSSGKTLRNNLLKIGLLLIFLMLVACRQLDNSKHEETAIDLTDPNLGIAIFAGGCFWCTESDFDKVPGVVTTISGYIGGTVANPTYKQVVAGKTGHVEAVQVYFDKSKINYAELLDAYWPTIDPLTPDRQFCDIGNQYRSAIFYLDEKQKRLAEVSKAKLEASNRFEHPIVTEILPASAFYPAEEYHQNYYLKNPLRYSYYRSNCGRDKQLEEIWGEKH